MICESCFVKEPKSRCLVCGKEKRFVIEGGGIALAVLGETRSPLTLSVPGAGKRDRWQTDWDSIVKDVRRGSILVVAYAQAAERIGIFIKNRGSSVVAAL